MFFNKFVVSMLENSISMGMFIFGKAYKVITGLIRISWLFRILAKSLTVN
jgi:hypothetical protein